MSCVPPHALVSGLALRIEREGYLPTPADLRALLGLGFTRDDLRAAFLARRATRADDAFARAVGVLDSQPDRA